jgi:hypothetical protein
MLPVQLWEKILVRRHDSRFGFDANINTLVELSDVQFTEAAIGRHYFEETNNGWCDQLSLIDKFGNQVLLEPVAMLILLKVWFPAVTEKRF